jgi:hypothetical protein
MTPSELDHALRRLTVQFPAATPALIGAALRDATRVMEYAGVAAIIGEVEEMARRCLALRSRLA